jgi:hypothetical protein
LLRLGLLGNLPDLEMEGKRRKEEGRKEEAREDEKEREKRKTAVSAPLLHKVCPQTPPASFSKIDNMIGFLKLKYSHSVESITFITQFTWKCVLARRFCTPAIFLKANRRAQ